MILYSFLFLIRTSILTSIIFVSLNLLNLFPPISGVEAMLPNPKLWSRGEEHAFYVIRTYRLGILVFVRPFLWQHVRLSANTASTSLQVMQAHWMISFFLELLNHRLDCVCLSHFYYSAIQNKCCIERHQTWKENRAQ
jgi:hypothetical protein